MTLFSCLLFSVTLCSLVQGLNVLFYLSVANSALSLGHASGPSTAPRTGLHGFIELSWHPCALGGDALLAGQGPKERLGNLPEITLVTGVTTIRKQKVICLMHS